MHEVTDDLVDRFEVANADVGGGQLAEYGTAHRNQLHGRASPPLCPSLAELLRLQCSVECLKGAYV